MRTSGEGIDYIWINLGRGEDGFGSDFFNNHEPILA